MFGLTAVEFFIAVIAIFVFTYWITPRKQIWIPMLLATVLLTVLAFHIEPNETDDLSRYFMQLDYLREYGRDYLQRCFDENANGSNWGTYRVCGYYCYYLSKLSDNHWMPAVTMAIVYGLMFLVLYKAANRFNISKPYLFIGAIFFLSTYWYYDTASGIRNGLTFAVIFACAYYHLVERKRIVFCYVGYVLASLMHSSGIMMVALIVLAEVTLNNSGKFMNFMLVFGLAGGGALMQFLATKTDNSFVQSIAGQAERHQAGDTLDSGTMFWVNVSLYIVVAFIVSHFSKIILNSDYAPDYKRFYKFSSIILYFMFGCLYSGLIFVRLARWVLPIIAALFLMIGLQTQKNTETATDMENYNNRGAEVTLITEKMKPIINIALVAYTAIHFWYLLTGSSLAWMHF